MPGKHLVREMISGNASARLGRSFCVTADSGDRSPIDLVSRRLPARGGYDLDQARCLRRERSTMDRCAVPCASGDFYRTCQRRRDLPAPASGSGCRRWSAFMESGAATRARYARFQPYGRERYCDSGSLLRVLYSDKTRRLIRSTASSTWHEISRRCAIAVSIRIRRSYGDGSAVFLRIPRVPCLEQFLGDAHPIGLDHATMIGERRHPSGRPPPGSNRVPMGPPVSMSHADTDGWGECFKQVHPGSSLSRGDRASIQRVHV